MEQVSGSQPSSPAWSCLLQIACTQAALLQAAPRHWG